MKTTRFERWRQKLAPDTAFLVSKICNRALPLFFNAGFVRLATYGGPNNLKPSWADVSRFSVKPEQNGQLSSWDLPILVVPLR
jgi:hypothetical protein